MTLDDVTNYFGVRLAGNTTRSWSFKNQNPPGADAGVIENKTEFMFPENFVLSPPARCPRMSDLWWSWDMMLKGAVPPRSEAS